MTRTPLAALALALLLTRPVAAADDPRPRWVDLPPDPYAQTDYTAYTLGFGEVGIGPRSVGIGILPGVQLTTQPIVDTIGMTNLSMKVDALTVGPLDVAANGTFGHRHEDPVNAVFVNGGGTASLILGRRVSVHGGAQWLYFATIGTPRIEPLAGVFPSLHDVPPEAIEYFENRFQYEIRVEMVMVNAAVDLRLNRRDSVVLQLSSPVWAHTQLPDWMEGYGTEDNGFLPVFETWSAGLAWQFHFRNLDLRLGVGAGSVPGSWISQSFDLRWRFGGPERKAYRKQLKAWRQGRDEP